MRGDSDARRKRSGGVRGGVILGNGEGASDASVCDLCA